MIPPMIGNLIVIAALVAVGSPGSPLYLEGP